MYFAMSMLHMQQQSLQVQELRAKASRERMQEADAMLASLAEQRQMAASAADNEVLLRKQQLHSAR